MSFDLSDAVAPLAAAAAAAPAAGSAPAAPLSLLEVLLTRCPADAAVHVLLFMTAKDLVATCDACRIYEDTEPPPIYGRRPRDSDMLIHVLTARARRQRECKFCVLPVHEYPRFRRRAMGGDDHAPVISERRVYGSDAPHVLEREVLAAAERETQLRTCASCCEDFCSRHEVSSATPSAASPPTTTVTRAPTSAR